MTLAIAATSLYKYYQSYKKRNTATDEQLLPPSTPLLDATKNPTQPDAGQLKIAAVQSTETQAPANETKQTDRQDGTASRDFPLPNDPTENSRAIDLE